MERRRGYRYRLDLSAEQADLARRTAGCCRLVYNLALEQRQTLWHQRRRSIGDVAQASELVDLKRAYPWLVEVPSHTLQQSVRDLDRAFANFFAGRARYPRYQHRGRDDTFRFPDPAQIKVRGSHVRLPKLGWCALRLSRPVRGMVKNATLGWQAGHWFVSFSTVEEVAEPDMVGGGEVVGLDVGVAAAVTLSDGTQRDVAGWTPCLLRRRLRLERSVARKRRGSCNQRKERARLARLHARARRRRHDAIHKLTTAIAKSHGAVAVEDLDVRCLTRSARGTVEEPGRNVQAKAGLNRAILQRAWGETVRQLGYKLAERGGALVRVPAAYSSQTCSVCWRVAAESRPSQAVFACVACGHTENADVNAAKVIRQRGMSLLAAAAGRAVEACGAVGTGRAVRQEIGIPGLQPGEDVNERSERASPVQRRLARSCRRAPGGVAGLDPDGWWELPMRHTKTKVERMLRTAERREERDAKRAVRRQAKAERRARRHQQVTTA